MATVSYHGNYPQEPEGDLYACLMHAGNDRGSSVKWGPHAESGDSSLVGSVG